MTINIMFGGSWSSIPLATVVDANGKIVAVKTYKTTHRQVTFLHCMQGQTIAFPAYEWLPVIDITGKTIKSGTVILNIEQKSSPKPRDSALGASTVALYDNKSGVHWITFAQFCAMVSQDVKSNSYRFVNLDYERLVRDASLGGLQDKALHVSGQVMGIIEDTDRYCGDVAASLSFCGCFENVYWNQRRDSNGALYLDWLNLEIMSSMERVWCPADLYFPHLNGGYMKCMEADIVYPKNVINWGIDFHTDSSVLNLTPPITVLCGTNIAISSVAMQKSFRVPYNGAFCSKVSLHSITGLEELLITDVSGCDTGEMGKTVSRQWFAVSLRDNKDLRRCHIELNPLNCNMISIKVGENLSEIYLCETRDVRCAYLEIRLSGKSNKSGIIYATPRVFHSLLRKKDKLAGWRIVCLDD